MKKRILNYIFGEDGLLSAADKDLFDMDARELTTTIKDIAPDL